MKVNWLQIKNKFEWHKWPIPKDITILSIYEVVAYIISFVVCCYIYNLLQIVPVQDDYVYRRLDIINHNTDEKRMGKSSLNYYIPMSYVLNCDTPSFTLKQYSLEKMEIAKLDRPANSVDSVIREFYHSYYISYKLKRNSSTIKELDSLRILLNSLLSDSIKQKNIQGCNYIRYNIKHNINSFKDIRFVDRKNGKSYQKQNEWYSDTLRTYFKALKALIKDNMFTMEWYGPYNDEFKIDNGAYKRPSLFSPYDISQSYYKLKLDGDFDDLGTIKYDFEGAIDVSNIYPVPDKLTMNYILYNDSTKISEIKENGLSFHVKFKELENYQNMRLFFITALLSALFAIFLSFIILSLYKGLIVRILKDKKDK